MSENGSCLGKAPLRQRAMFGKGPSLGEGPVQQRAMLGKGPSLVRDLFGKGLCLVKGHLW